MSRGVKPPARRWAASRLELVPKRQEDRAALVADLQERMKRVTTTAFQRDPGLQQRVRDISTGKSPVFQAGDLK